MTSCTALLLLCTMATTAQQAPLVSPEVHPDRKVTFRMRSPGATKVEVSLEGKGNLAMTKGANGVWTVTTDPLDPDYYGYSFGVDGVTYLDPLNPLQKPNLIWASNMVHVPGKEVWDLQDVPRGSVHRHYYKSKIIGDHRDYFVYTPPGYNATGRTKYPVLYLLHGYSDTANGWTSVGMAHVILDNLIAARKVKPMLVVMPLGYGVPDFASPNGSGFRVPGTVQRNYDNFRAALIDEVIPSVEKDYRVSPARTDRAIAGLSMGGAESLYTGLNRLDKFAYVGSFSAGGLPQGPDVVFPSLKGETVNKELKLLWIGCGTEDGLIEMNRGLDKWLKGKDVKLTYVETPGGHTWMVWRRYLATFAPLLFR